MRTCVALTRHFEPMSWLGRFFPPFPPIPSSLLKTEKGMCLGTMSTFAIYHNMDVRHRCGQWKKAWSGVGHVLMRFERMFASKIRPCYYVSTYMSCIDWLWIWCHLTGLWWCSNLSGLDFFSSYAYWDAELELARRSGFLFVPPPPPFFFLEGGCSEDSGDEIWG